MGTWRIPFKSDSDDQYEIHIYGMSSDKTLLPDENPFTTAHDTSEDFFLPIREGSGYIRCIGKVGDVDELYVNNSATHHVDLFFENSVIWTGACKAEAYTQPYTPGYVSIEIPLVDTVAMLDGEYFPTSRTRPMSVDEVIFTILEMLNVSISYLHFPYRTKPDDLQGHYLQPLNWIKPLDEPDISGNRYEISTLKEVMEDICKTYGWSLRQEGCDWYFTSLDVTDSDLHGDTYYKVDPSDFSSQQFETVSPFTNINPADTKHNMSLYQGKRSVKVEGNAGEFDTDVYKLDFNNFNYINRRSLSKNYEKTVTYLNSFGFKPDSSDEKVWNYLSDSANNMPLATAFQKYINGSGMYDTGVVGVGFEAYDFWIYDKSKTEKHAPNYKEAMIMCPGYNGGMDGVSFSPNRIITTTQDDTYLFINADLNILRAWGDPLEEDSNFTLMVQVKFGNYYLQQGQDDEPWTTVPTYVPLYFSEGKAIRLALRTYNIRWYQDVGGHGACVKLPSGMSGKVEIKFRIPVIPSENKYVALMLSDFEVNVRKVSNRYDTPTSTNTAKSYIGRGNKEDYEVSSNLTCARGNQSGYGVILRSPYIDQEGNETYANATSLDITYDAPEVALMNRLRAYYSTSYRLLDITLKNNAPSPLNVVSIGGRNYVPIAVERDYIRNNYKTRFIERK